MGGKKDRGRINRAKQVAAAAAAIVPPSAPVQERPAPSHTFDDLETRAPLVDKLARATEEVLKHIRREIDPEIAAEFGSDVVAVAAAAMRGDPKAQFSIVAGRRKERTISRTEYTQILEMALHQNNAGVQLWFGIQEVEYLIIEADARGRPEGLPMGLLRDEEAWDIANMHLATSAVSCDTTRLGHEFTRWVAPKAQYVLGIVKYQSAYESDDMTDFLDAARWMRKAATQSVMEAQYELGKMFLHGHFFDVHMRFARKYITRASKQGHVDATACMKELRSCVFCGADDAPLACSRCRQARYCGITCSRKHWCDGGGVGRDVNGDATERHKDICPRTHKRRSSAFTNLFAKKAVGK